LVGCRRKAQGVVSVAVGCVFMVCLWCSKNGPCSPAVGKTEAARHGTWRERCLAARTWLNPLSDVCQY